MAALFVAWLESQEAGRQNNNEFIGDAINEIIHQLAIREALDIP